MNRTDWQQLQRGDILTHKLGGDSWVVTDNLGQGEHIIMVRTMMAANPREWDLYDPDPTPVVWDEYTGEPPDDILARLYGRPARPGAATPGPAPADGDESTGEPR